MKNRNQNDVNLGDFVSAKTVSGIEVQGILVRRPDKGDVASVLSLVGHEVQWHRCRKGSVVTCDAPSELFAVQAALSNHFWDR